VIGLKKLLFSTYLLANFLSDSLLSGSAISQSHSNIQFQRVNQFMPPASAFKAAKYEIQKPSTCRATLFRCKFWSVFPVFHLAWSTCRAAKTFVAGLRKLMRKVDHGSTQQQILALLLVFHQTHNLMRNKFARAQANQPISALRFFSPQQMFLLRVKLITQDEKRYT